MPEPLEFDPRNIPVVAQMTVSFDVGGETFSLHSDVQKGCINPWEHSNPESYLADCQAIVRDIWNDISLAFKDKDQADKVALRVGLAGQFVADKVDA